MSNLLDIFNSGGIPLVIVAAFLYFLQWQGKYFIKQIDAQTEERKELIEKFDEMLNNHCQTVTDALEKQVKLPLLNIIDATAANIQREGLKKIGLFMIMNLEG